MKFKCIAIIIVIISVSAFLWAEDTNNERGLGLHFGALSSSGYAMRWMDTDKGWQATFGAYTHGNNRVRMPSSIFHDDTSPTVITHTKNGRETALNLGLSYMHILDSFRNGRFYIIGGGSYKYVHKVVHSMDYTNTGGGSIYYTAIPSTRTRGSDAEYRWTIGAGPGFDFFIGKKVSIALEIPFNYNWRHNFAMFSPQAGLYYYFR